jgi:hypothetical protein
MIQPIRTIVINGSAFERELLDFCEDFDGI